MPWQLHPVFGLAAADEARPDRCRNDDARVPLDDAVAAPQVHVEQPFRDLKKLRRSLPLGDFLNKGGGNQPAVVT